MEDESSVEVRDSAVAEVVSTLDSAVLPLVLSVAVLVAVVVELLEDRLVGASVVIKTMMLVLLLGVIPVVNTAVVVVPEGLKLRKKRNKTCILCCKTTHAMGCCREKQNGD